MSIQFIDLHVLRCGSTNLLIYKFIICKSLSIHKCVDEWNLVTHSCFAAL